MASPCPRCVISSPQRAYIPLYTCFKCVSTNFTFSEEYPRAQQAVEKYIAFAKKHGTRTQYRHAMQIQLPSSPVYDILEGLVPHPAQTYNRAIELAELEEKEFINREIGERRTRLGAKIDQVTMEVKLEAFKRSEIDQLYRGVIDWTNDDEVRRTYEEKLLQRAYDYLLLLPHDEKAKQLELVQKSAHDMVIIKHPFMLAWKIVLEWNDVAEILELDNTLLSEFVHLFPEDGVSKVLRGFIGSGISPFPKDILEKADENKQEKKQEKKKAEPEESRIIFDDYLLLMAEGLEQSPPSILSHRIMDEVYLSLEEFQTTVNTCRKGLSMMTALQRDTSLSLQKTIDATKTTLATALISYQSPKNHPEARRLFQNVLERDPISTMCLLGIGLILEEEHDYAGAMDFLTKALERNTTNAKIRSELSWCRAQSGELQVALDDLESTLELINGDSKWQNLKSEVLYRIGYCQWELDPSASARKDRSKAYANFLASIQSDMNYAPSYTSLGIYYADYKRDRKRARRCFHKAFEVSSSEIESAERLARDFADQREWDLVEAVARRVVESGKAKPAPGSKRRGHSWPYAVLGVVEINRQQYAKSIVGFQTALRISPNDYQCWVGLGESYYNAGRYIAATKAFQNAESLEVYLSSSEKDQVWFSKYMMANVKRELGDHEGAISIYETVLELKPQEFGVSVALLQTLTESSWKAVELGLFGEAATTAVQAIETGISITDYHPNGFNLWKSIGDAFSIFSWIKGKVPFIPIAQFKSVLESKCDPVSFNMLSDSDGVGANLDALLEQPSSDEPANLMLPMNAAILAYKYALSVAANDVHARAVAWYNLGWAEYRAHHCSNVTADQKKKSKRRGFLKASIRCFKRAIELEAGNPDFWNALGVATTSLSPKVAQHSFVRSLHLNERSALVWTNLGALYLLHGDYQLANEAFTRAQSADPDWSHAWLGQALLATLFGDENEARELTIHAFELGNSSVVFPKQQYAISLFDHVSTNASHLPQLLQPLFALHKLHVLEPSNTSLEHLLALFAERTAGFSDAIKALESVCAEIEAQYEQDESIPTLLKYSQAKADLARVQLGQLEYEAAAESAETALDLSADDTEGLDQEQRRVLRLSAHLTAGLAQYYLRDMDKAIDMFRDALQESESSPDVICALSQVLWAKGGDQERMVAREQLFDCVEKHPDHVGATTLLGVIALLDQDEDAVEAVESDLQSMRTRGDLDIHEKAKIVQILAAISALESIKTSGSQDTSQWVQEAAASVMLTPGQPQGWMALSIASSERFPADMAVRTALKNIPPHGTLTALELSKAFALSSTRESVLRATMMAPWSPKCWKELSSHLEAS